MVSWEVGDYEKGRSHRRCPRQIWGVMCSCAFGEMLGVKSEKTAEELGGVWWQLWGAHQRAWLETARGADGTRRVQLRTGAIQWFPGSLAQLSELSAELPVPTLAGMVRRVDQPSRLELATSLEVREDTIEWVLKALPAAARMQAAEARLLSQSKALGRVGLIPEVDVEAKAPSTLSLRRGNLLQNRRAPEARRSSLGRVGDLRVRCRPANKPAPVPRTKLNLTGPFCHDITAATHADAAERPVPLPIGRGISVAIRFPKIISHAASSPSSVYSPRLR
jgi:hypothetical protein